MYSTATPPSRLPSTWVSMGPVVREMAGPPSVKGLDLASGLRLVGLPVRQARLYLALSRGPQTARRAAQIAGFHRATAYRVLVRLLERGLVAGDGRIPQRFEAVPPELIFARLEGFLRDEADLSSLLTISYGRWARAGPSPEALGRPGEIPPRLLIRERGGRDPTLAQLETTRHTLDVIARPVSCPVAFRTALLRTLGNLLRRGVKIRLLMDATPMDQRFSAALLREAGEGRQRLTRRHLAPIGTHCYLSDSRIALRLPVLGVAGQVPEMAVAEEDPARFRMLSQRFEVLWTQASDPFGPSRSTRSYAWTRAAGMFREHDASAGPALSPVSVVPAFPGR
jgi:Sugar-specific transcriptional regulator TrmB